MRRSIFFISCALIIACISGNAFASKTVRYPQAGEVFTKHHRYPVELLNLALSYHAKQVEVQPSAYFMNQGRAIKQLHQGKDIDVMWTMTSRERESEVKPIRIPIYKGLIGWRLFLTTPEQQHAQPLAWEIEELKRASLIQGHDWPDTEILRYNDFNVVKGPNYEGLFKILSLNRAQLFPRSIIEIWDELETHEQSNIILESHTLISYPTATYFFVSPNNTELAGIIEQGLRKAIDDGSFNKLFNQYYSDLISKAQLSHRRHYRLVNPLLPEATPLDQKPLWFHIELD